MALNDYVPPQYQVAAFNCPHCQAFAHQKFEKASLAVGTGQLRMVAKDYDGLDVCTCARCGELSLWYFEELVYPTLGRGPEAHSDMPPDVQSDYEEARAVAAASPRSAAALLRLALQKLLVHLGSPPNDLNQAIADIVAKGLDPRVQKALDIVRITGNNAVHPGELNLRDEPATVERLFALINYVVQATITNAREIDQLWDKMPPASRLAQSGVVRRSSKAFDPPEGQRETQDRNRLCG